MGGEYDALRALLSDRPIAFHPLLARVLGGVYEALLFQQLAYWSNKGTDPEWIYKTRDELQKETTLNRYQQEQARATLRRLGVVEEERRGLPARMHYHVVWDRVYQLLEEHRAVSSPSANKMAEDQPTGERDSTNQLAEDEPTSKSTQRKTTKNGPESIESSKGPTLIFDEERDAIASVLRDFARELGDTAPLPSTISRAVNVYRTSQWELNAFLDALYEARRITQERTAAIRTESPQKLGPKNKIPYFFRVLESVITGQQRREG
jgi:hypothetical protein